MHIKILMTGAAGVTGSKLRVNWDDAGHQVIPVDIVKGEDIVTADLRNIDTVFALAEEYSPDVILHLAANKDLLFCEQNQEIAHATNYGITDNLSRACSEFGTRLVFFSSDYVFGEFDNFWNESDQPCPINQYGRDKADSEAIIQDRLSDYAIVRTANIYGVAGDFIGLVRDTLASHQKFMAIANLVHCMTWVEDLFLMISRIINNNERGIFHCVGPEARSRYQYACEIAETLALDASLIKAVNLDFSKDVRPPAVRLNGAYTYDILDVCPGTVRDNISSDR